ncbi:MAG: hypothetical protein ACFE9D_09120 [Promethearchaeota archaeon]
MGLIPLQREGSKCDHEEHIQTDASVYVILEVGANLTPTYNQNDWNYVNQHMGGAALNYF